MTPRKKSLLKLVWLALLARFCTNTLLMTACSTSDLKEKKHVGRNKTQAVAGVNSLNSSRWNPRILCNTTNEGQGDLGRQLDSRRKWVAGTVAHQSVLIAFHISLGQEWWYALSASVLVETDSLGKAPSAMPFRLSTDGVPTTSFRMRI